MDTGYQENPGGLDDRIAAAMSRFNRFGDVLWPTARRIYSSLAVRVLGRRVVDVGCGCGFGTMLLRPRNSSVVGVDTNQVAVCFAKSIYPDGEWGVWDISSTPYPGRAEVVVSVDVLEHIKDYRSAARNLALSATEELWLSTPNRKNASCGKTRPTISGHVREFTPEEVLELFKGSNVTILRHDSFETTGVDDTSTPLVYRIR